MSGAVVLCVGNPFRRDDGAAAAVAGIVRDACPPGVRVVDLDGDPARAVEAWAGAELAVVVDAARATAPPGTVRRVEVAAGAGPGGAGQPGVGPPTAARAPASSHGWSLGDAVALGRALGRLPRRLVLYTVAGRDFADGPGLSGPVARAVPGVAAAVIDEAAPVGAAAPPGAHPAGRAGAG
ncbi:MAG TPA: hydrogenase maturation protease [Acidimicrobiales bacterium]